MSEPGDEIERTRRAELVLSLRSRGVRHLRTLAAIETIPRSMFAPSRLAEHAYADRALPIACGQAMERPSEIAKAIDALAVGELDTVLEIGSGSGYATAIFAQISRRLFTVERYRTLAENAERRVRGLGNADHVVFSVSDGLLGLPDHGPFERIFVSASVEAPPSALLNQLKPGGIMIAPIGLGREQRLTRVTKARDGSLEEFTIGAACVAPMVPGVAAAL